MHGEVIVLPLLHATMAVFILTYCDLLNDEIVKDLNPSSVSLLIIATDLLPHQAPHCFSQVLKKGEREKS